MVIALIVMSVAFSIISIFVSYYYLPYDFSIGGRSITGTIALIIERSISFVIDHPQNTTYNFSIGDNYILSLNVSPRFDVQSWWYTLHDLRHNEIVNQSVIFTPNTTITAVRWSNNLTVYANESNGRLAKESVIFFVSVPNSAPLIRNMPNEYLACEDSSLYVYFNASDVDEDNLTASISPSGTFFVTSAMSNINLTWRRSNLFSGTLGKSNVGANSRTISVSDSSLSESDSKNVNITVIEINHAPSVSNIGVHTIYSRGENSSFYYEVQVNDIEHGSNESSGNFTFNLTFLSGTRFLNITNGGVINGSANSSLVGVHSISVCVNDSGLSTPHANISTLCGTNGGSLISCVNFSITVTDANRAPTITGYSPSDLTLSVNGNGSLISFNITKYDPDGTAPDTYWYFDNAFKEIDSGSLNDIFSVLFSTCVSESHTIKAVITDGLVNDSIQWNITVNPDVSCTPTVTGGGGGGGGGGVAVPSCKALWGCATWGICDNLEDALKKGALARDNYRELKERCTYAGFKESDCGYQNRICLDVNSCNNAINKPEDTRVCYYTIAPSCSDKVKNCHDMDCEVLVDCGGPCAACPTCSDNVQNQGEEKVDCGGPCTPCVEKLALPKIKVNYLVLILTALGIIAIVLIIRIIRFRGILESAG